jgi:riboflavin synthase alpha subunit
MVNKGSIAVDGVNLTVVAAGNRPLQRRPDSYTLARTTLGKLKVTRRRQPRKPTSSPSTSSGS